MRSETQFLLEFLELYKSLPAVWKMNSYEYRNRKKKNEAYDVLIKKCKELEPNADRDYVTRKIKSLRCSYKKEQKKLEQQLMLGNNYKSNLWYFKHLSFLKDQDDIMGNRVENKAADCELRYQAILKYNAEERKFWQEFLELYKSLPALWKLNSEEYNSKIKKSTAYNILVEKCKELAKDADREFVNKKINDFHYAFNRELNTVEQEFKAGNDYKPTLWCYKALSFLENQANDNEINCAETALEDVSDLETEFSIEDKVFANKQDEKSWKQFWIEFFELYKNLPAAWQRKSKVYHDRNEKAMAYKALVEKCKEIDPEADRNFVVKKINTFRCAYRKEQKKVKQAVSMGKSYKPSLWYYHLLNFVDNQDDSEPNSENEFIGEENSAILFCEAEVGENEEPDGHEISFEMSDSQCKRDIENLKLFWSEFFELYKSLPALWNIESKEYKDHHQKLMAYNILIEKYKVLNPTAHKAVVIAKIKALKSLYFKELIRVEREKLLGNDYKPTLWYFQHLSFLETCLKTKTNAEKLTLQEQREDLSQQENHKFWSEFFKLLKSLPVLWDPKSKEYTNSYKRFLAYNILINKCKEIYPSANKDFVIRKINYFRSVYRMEMLKIKQETMLGRDYKPTQSCFHQWSFLEEDSYEVFRKFWLQFFELLKSLPALWNKESEEYKNRNKKDEAYQLLISKCQEINPNADKDFVNKKIRRFLNFYNKERKKLLVALEAGQEYKPTLWYFQHLDFLKDQAEALEIEDLNVSNTCAIDKQRKFWTEFIELYKSLPAAWKIKSREYQNHLQRTQAFNVLLKKYQEINPVADKSSVSKKISHFRKTYKREQLKVIEALQAGREYKPSLWYFDQLNFLKNEEDLLEAACPNYETKNEPIQENLSTDCKNNFNLKQYERNFWSEFLELYKNLPAVWKTKSDKYKDRNEKTKAYDILIKKCREIESNATRDFVVKKINVFRCSYRKELKKIKQKAKAGIEYKPTLWYFGNLSFLKNQEDSLEESFNDIDWESNSAVAKGETNFQNNLSTKASEEVKFQVDLSQAVSNEIDFDDEMDESIIKIEEEQFQDDFSNLADNENEFEDCPNEEKTNEKVIKMEDEEENLTLNYTNFENNEPDFSNFSPKDEEFKEIIKIEGEDFQEDLSNEASSNQSDFEGFQSSEDKQFQKNLSKTTRNFEDYQYENKITENSKISEENNFPSELSSSESDTEDDQPKDKLINSSSHESDFEEHQYETVRSETSDMNNPNHLQENLSRSEDLREQNQQAEFNAESDTTEDSLDFEILPHEQKFWSSFLELYKNLPALWKVNSEEYNNETKKSLAYDTLIEKCKEIEPKADKKFVLTKMNYFRKLFKKEQKKVEEEFINENDYKPPFWYFNCLNLFNDEENSLAALRQDSDEGDKQNEDKYSEKSHSDVQDRPHTSSFKKKKHRPSNSDELLELATKRLKRCDDYSQTLANVWASEFRLASEEQKFFAKKAIDDILFEARLGTLHRNSVKINESPMNNEYSVYNSKRESLNCGSPDSATDSITIERVGIDNHENDI